jgi:hypothetical protein
MKWIESLLKRVKEIQDGRIFLCKERYISSRTNKHFVECLSVGSPMCGLCAQCMWDSDAVDCLSCLCNILLLHLSAVHRL